VRDDDCIGRRRRDGIERRIRGLDAEVHEKVVVDKERASADLARTA
jgi:hypothetical protein